MGIQMAFYVHSEFVTSVLSSRLTTTTIIVFGLLQNPYTLLSCGLSEPALTAPPCCIFLMCVTERSWHMAQLSPKGLAGWPFTVHLEFVPVVVQRCGLAPEK